MKKIFSIRKIQFGLPLLGAMFLFTISNAQLVQKWQREVFSLGSRPLVKNAVLLTSDGNIVSAGTTKLMKFNPDGNQLWAADLPKAARPRSNGTAMATDQSGNIYLTIVGGADVNINFGDIDIFIAKYNAAGQQLWSKIYNSPEGGDDESVGIGIDQLGNVYITGNVYIDDNRQRIHTAKFNTDGILQWSVTYNDVSFSLARAIAVDFFTGDVYVAGKTFQGVDEDDPHFDDFTTIKYNTNGEQQWIALYNGNPPDFGVPNDEARAIALDADGNVLVTGFSNESFESNSAGIQDAFVFSTFKYDRITGHEIWHKKYGAGESEGGDTFNDIANAIAVDDDGNVIVTGTARLKTDGSTEWATIKYRKSDGKTVWDKRFNNKEFIPRDIFDDDQDAAFAVAVDAANNVYVTGYSTANETGRDFFTVKYQASNGTEMGRARSNSGPNDESGDIAVDAVGNTYITGNGGEFGGSVTTIKYGLCSIVCPQNIAVNNEPGKCEAVVNFSATTTGNCGELVFLDGQDTVSSGSSFAVGTHIILVKSPSTEETCSFTITVIDNEKPVITESPASLTVSCAADVPLPDIKLVKATDNCGDVTISHAGDVISDQTCANRFTLTRTYKATDSHGNTATCSQVITVNDIVPPRITDFSLSRESLFPPNHTMQDITLNYQVFDNCVSSPLLTVRVSSNEPVNGTGDGDTDPDWLVIDPHHVQLRAERSGIGNGRIYTITVTADDGCNPAVSVTKQVFVAHNITGPQTGNPFRIGSTVSLNGVFWDKPGNKHTAKWLLDGSVASNGTVVEPSGNQNGKVSGSYKFNSAGVYKMQMNVTDQSGVTSYANTNGDLEAIVVIYDPNGSNVYGGGWYNSPAGALAGNPLATGKASYGFAVNYKNPIKPQGETQFEFKSGSFEFNAVNFDYLAVNGATAQFKGTGKITGGQSGIGFIMTVSDGALDGSNVDKIRMKVYNRSTGVVIYDNQPGTSDAVLPATAVGTNSVIVIQGNNINASVVNTKQENLSEDKTMVDGLTVSAYPNPTKNYFTISVNSNNKEEIMLQVFDQEGRTMDVRRNVIPGSVIRFGDKYMSGAYYVRIMQGKEHKEIKLIKVPD